MFYAQEFQSLLNNLSPSKKGLILTRGRSSAKEKQTPLLRLLSCLPTYNSDHKVAMASTSGLWSYTQNVFFLQTLMGSWATLAMNQICFGSKADIIHHHLGIPMVSYTEKARQPALQSIHINEALNTPPHQWQKETALVFTLLTGTI